LDGGGGGARRRDSLFLFVLLSGTETLAGRLVVAHAQEDGMAQVPPFGPLLVADLDHHFGLDPDGSPDLPHRHRWAGAADGSEPGADLLVVLAVEAGAHRAGVGQA